MITLRNEGAVTYKAFAVNSGFIQYQLLGAYIGLAERKALYVSGSDVRNLSANAVGGGVVEFADIAVTP